MGTLEILRWDPGIENLMPGKGWGEKELSQGSSPSFPAKKPFPLFLVTLPSGV